jgi:hypothetical protein
MSHATRLPMRPLVFLLLYLLLATGPILLAFLTSRPNSLLIAVGIFAAIALHLIWIRDAMVITDQAIERQRGQSVGSVSLIRNAPLAGVVALLLAWVLLVMSTHLPESNVVQNKLGVLFLTFLGLSIVAFLLSIWRASISLCMAESGRMGALSSIWLTHVLFLYLPLGAPFLMHRLRRLGPEEG